MDTGLKQMKNKIESVVIVKGEHGSVATIRFKDGKDDKIISATSKPTLYVLIEQHVNGILNG